MQDNVKPEIDLAPEILSLMARKNCKQNRIAKEAGVEAVTVSRVLKGKSLTYGNYKRLRDYLDSQKPPVGLSVSPAPLAPLGSVDRYIASLEARIEEMSKRIDAMTATLQSAIDDRKTDVNRIDGDIKRHAELIGQTRTALIQAEKLKDWLPLKILSGTG